MIESRQVVLEVGQVVTLLQRDLEHFQSGDERRQSRQTLLAAAADADQQRVSARSLQDAVDAHHVEDGVIEEDQIHRGVEFVVAVERLLQQPTQLRVVGDRQVLGVADAGREVAVEQRLAQDEIVVVVLEALLDHLVLDLVVEVDVASLHHLVAVDAVALVHPKANQLDDVLATVRRGEQQSLQRRHNEQRLNFKIYCIVLTPSMV